MCAGRTIPAIVAPNLAIPGLFVFLGAVVEALVAFLAVLEVLAVEDSAGREL